MGDIVDEMMAQPGRLRELNRQFTQNAQLLTAWFGMFAQNMHRITVDEVYAAFLEITAPTLQMRLRQPHDFAELMAVFRDVLCRITQAAPGARQTVLKQLLLSSVEDGVYQQDVYDLIEHITSRVPEMKQQLVALTEIVFDELRDKISLKQIVFSEQF